MSRALGFVRGAAALTLVAALALSGMSFASADDADDPVAVTTEPAKKTDDSKPADPPTKEEKAPEPPKETKAASPEPEPQIDPAPSEKPSDPPAEKKTAKLAPQPSEDDDPDAGKDGIQAAGFSLPAGVADIEPPYLRWRVVDSAGDLVAGTTVQVTIAIDGIELTTTVEDNTGEDDYSGLDRDPTQGQFVLKQLTDDDDPDLSHEVDGDETYQVGVVGSDPTPVTSSTSDEDKVQEIASAPKVAARGGVDGLVEPQLTAGDGDGPIAYLTGEPDGAGVTAPYAYWTVVDLGGNPVAGATFSFQRRNTSGTNWQSSLAVSDCVAAGCTGIDRDADGGDYQAKWIGSATPGNPPSGDTIVAGGRYRVAPSSPPSGYVWVSSTDWVDSNDLTWSGSGDNRTLNFGQFVVRPADPSVPANSSIIEVRVGGTRTGGGNGWVTGLSGVVLGLYANETGESSLFTCTSDANGFCRFIIPNTNIGGVNRDKQFWVRQISAPSDWYSNHPLGTGDLNANPNVSSDNYAFQTGTQLRAGNIYRSTSDFMYSTSSSNDASSGIWQNSRNNPTFPAKCGINVALILDTSGSMSGSMGSMRSAAKGFVDALAGTNSQVATYRFATSASLVQSMTPVSTTAGATSVKDQIDTLQTASGGTNWDRGLYQVARSSDNYDVAIIVTDGNPTYLASPVQGSGNRVRFQELEAAIFSANAIKAEGTRLIAFGVGVGVNSAESGYNLRAISGTALNSDYYRSTDWSSAATSLRELALGKCNGTLTVVKQVVPASAPAGSIAGATPQGGWVFTTSATNGITVTGSPGTTASGTGAVNFPLDFPTSGTTGTATVTETQQSDHTLQQVGGKNAVCVRVDTQAALNVTNNGALGFDVGISPAYPVSCTVYNRNAPSTTLTLVKTVVNNHGGTSTVPNWTLTATGPTTITGVTGASSVTNAVITAGVYTLSEAGSEGYDPSAWTCKDAADQTVSVTADSKVTVAQGANVTCRITNTDKPGSVAWSKVDATTGLALAGTEWSITGPSFEDEPGVVTDCTTAACSGLDQDSDPGKFRLEGLDWGQYTVTETAAPAGYVMGGASFTFTISGNSLTYVLDEVIENTRILGTVTWTKVDASNTNTKLAGSEWTLTLPDGTTKVTVTDCTASPCPPLTSNPYADQDPAVGAFKLADLPWGGYTLVEKKAPPGYLLDSTVHPFTIGPNAPAKLTWDLGPIENVPVTPPSLPLTGGISRDFYTLLGLGVLGSALLAYGISQGRARRRLESEG